MQAVAPHSTAFVAAFLFLRFWGLMKAWGLQFLGLSEGNELASTLGSNGLWIM
jgi:hypothetical protein